MSDEDLASGAAANTGEITGEVIPPPKPQHPGMANLRSPWRKGQSGNRAGRPKTKPLTDALRKVLGKRVPPADVATLVAKAPNILAVVGKRPTYADILAYSTVQQGIRGNIAATARILDRVEGRIPKEVMPGDAGRLDELMQVLLEGPVAPGEVNEGAPDTIPDSPSEGLA